MTTTWILDSDITIDDPEVQAIIEGASPQEGFEPYCFEIPVGFGFGPLTLRTKRCCRCGGQAARAELRISTGRRTCFCEACR